MGLLNAEPEELEALLARQMPSIDPELAGPFRVLSVSPGGKDVVRCEVAAYRLVAVDPADPALRDVSVPVPVSGWVELCADGSQAARSLPPPLPEAVHEARLFARDLIARGAVSGLPAGGEGRPRGRPTHEVQADDAGCSRSAPAAVPLAGLCDALVAMAEHALASGEHALGARRAADRRQLLVHVTEERLTAARTAEPRTVPVGAELHDGAWLRADTLYRLGCDAGLVLARTDRQGRVLDVGRRLRSVPAPLLRALWLRDRSCRFPGCTARAFVEAHHIQHWVHGGPTSLENTALLCHAHHVAVHEGGFGLARDAHGGLRFTDRDGRDISRAPEAPAPPDDALGALSSEQTRAGIEITRTTSLPRRDFRRGDLRAAASAVVARTPGLAR